MNRISFLKRLLATVFGAALSPSLQANSSLRAQRGKLNTSVIPTEREESKRYLLSATVAGTPYYDFPEVGMGLFNSPPDPLSLEERGKASQAKQGVSSSECHPELVEPSEASSRPKAVTIGHPATLQLEPTNAFDYKAIEVYWNNHKMGYIPRRHNKVLYNLMKDGAQLEAKIRLQYAFDPEELINIADELDAYHLRIRVYLVSENERSLLC